MNTLHAEEIRGLSKTHPFAFGTWFSNCNDKYLLGLFPSKDINLNSSEFPSEYDKKLQDILIESSNKINELFNELLSVTNK